MEVERKHDCGIAFERDHLAFVGLEYTFRTTERGLFSMRRSCSQGPIDNGIIMKRNVYRPDID